MNAIEKLVVLVLSLSGLMFGQAQASPADELNEWAQMQGMDIQLAGIEALDSIESDLIAGRKDRQVGEFIALQQQILATTPECEQERVADNTRRAEPDPAPLYLDDWFQVWDAQTLLEAMIRSLDIR